MKICNKCFINKSYSEFYKGSLYKDGYINQCKDCKKYQGSIYRENNKETIKEKNKIFGKKWRLNNIEKCKEASKKWRDANGEHIKEYSKQYYAMNIDRIKEYRVSNRDYSSLYRISYYNLNKSKLIFKNNLYKKNRKLEHPLFKLSENIRTLIYNSFTRNSINKNLKTQEILGCSFEEFKIYLESKFESWMTWENRGLYNGELNYGWDIDHIIPTSSAESEEDLIKLNHYTNLQPLCSKVNRYIKKIKQNMRFIKSRKKFLNEAKIRDVILPRQLTEFKDKWGEKWLDYEEIEATEKIKQGRWKVSDEDKIEILGAHFQCDMKAIMDTFSGMPDKLATLLRESINFDLFKGDDKDKYMAILSTFNPKAPTVDQITIFSHSVFRRLSLTETLASEVIQKDENGRPVRGEDGQMLKIAKEPGAPVFEKNLTNINGFLDVYNKAFASERVSSDLFNNGNLNRLINMAAENHNGDYKYDHEIFGKDLYIQILHNPKDILNMSISKFYSSCQHLYSGGYSHQVIGNVFDPNSIPAFFVFDTPIIWKKEKIADILPLSRMMIRNIEGFDAVVPKAKKARPVLYFDRAYPDRMRGIMCKMVEKYSDNKESVKEKNRSTITYTFTPDVDLDDTKKINVPYMDRLGIQVKPFIGVNTKVLYLNRSYDWSQTRISPKARIKELIIETTDLPEGLTKIALTPDWIKFKFIKINDMNVFEKIKADAIAFDKCKFNAEILGQLAKNNPELKKLQITSCDVTGEADLSAFTNLDELHLIYTLENNEELINLTKGLKIKKLIISGDMVSSKEAKQYIGKLKSAGVKVEILGPVI